MILHAVWGTQVTQPTQHVNDVWKGLTTPKHVKEALGVLAGDTLQNLPTEYLPEFRNPCWQAAGGIKCLPYFQILGGCMHACMYTPPHRTALTWGSANSARPAPPRCAVCGADCKRHA